MSDIAKGPVALVTGGGTGIGLAIAHALSARHYRVAICGRRSDVIDRAAAELVSEEPVLGVTCDASDEADVDRLFGAIIDRFGRLDLLVNNAGMTLPSTPIEDISFAQWQMMFAANLTSAMLCTQRAVRVMKAQSPSGGRIINNGSISAHVPRPMFAPYTIMKHGISGLTKATALEGRPFRIACGQIDIGNASTALTQTIQSGTLQADGSLRSEPTMDAVHVAEAVANMADLPLEANVLTMTIMATQMPYVGRG